MYVRVLALASVRNTSSFFRDSDTAYMKLDLFVLGALVFFAVIVGVIGYGTAEGFQENAISNGGEVRIEIVDAKTGRVKTAATVEVARTPTEIERGLMHRRSIAENGGMLFFIDPAGERSFWMRNTLVPLDMIFVGPDERIINIRKSVAPLSEESQPSGGVVQYVVELPGGTTTRRGLGIGDMLRIL